MFNIKTLPLKDRKVLLNRKFIVPTYNKQDTATLEKEIMKMASSGEVLTLSYYKDILKRIGIKSAIGFETITRDLELAEFKGRSVSRGIVQFTEKTLNSKSVNSAIKTSLRQINNHFSQFLSSVGESGLTKDNFNDFKKKTKNLAKMEVARITNKSNDLLAEEIGIKEYMWGATSSLNANPYHEVLVGEISKVGESPSPTGEMPGENEGCNCHMIYLGDSKNE